MCVFITVKKKSKEHKNEKYWLENIKIVLLGLYQG